MVVGKSIEFDGNAAMHWPALKSPVKSIFNAFCVKIFKYIPPSELKTRQDLIPTRFAESLDFWVIGKLSKLGQAPYDPHHVIYRNYYQNEIVVPSSSGQGPRALDPRTPVRIWLGLSRSRVRYYLILLKHLRLRGASTPFSLSVLLDFRQQVCQAAHLYLQMNLPGQLLYLL